MLRIHSLFVYPIKSCRGISLSAAQAEHQGFSGDRRWMVVDEQGYMLTARKVPELLLVQPLLAEDGVWLTAPGMSDLKVQRPLHGDSARVQIWRDSVEAYIAQAGSEWFSAYLKQPVRLVWMPAEPIRRVDPDWVPEPGYTGFADGFPVLVACQSSLDDLSHRLGQTLSMQRFRPNLVVSGSPPWAEDGWHQLACGSVRLKLCKPCSRCVMTTLDPETLAREPAVLSTLASFRKQSHGVIFGQNAVVVSGGPLRVGDVLTVKGG